MSTITAENDTGLLELTLQVSTDGNTWYPMVFEGESPAFIDRSAVIFIEEYRGTIGLGLDENTQWSLFPKTFDAVMEYADQVAAAQSVPALI